MTNRIPVKIGDTEVGGGRVVVQSMTNTDTADAKSTAQQIYQLHQAGSELVRITVNNEESAAAVPEIIDRLRAAHCEVPVIGDFHYNGHRLLQDYPACAEKLAKYRINPGNVADLDQLDGVTILDGYFLLQPGQGCGTFCCLTCGCTCGNLTGDIIYCAKQC